MSYKITPVKELPRKKEPDKELTDRELWGFGWIMWKMGNLIRFRIKGVCDMNTPVRTPHQFTRNYKPRIHTRN